MLRALQKMSMAPGVRLGAYEIVALIGAGGMGEVYRARDTRLGRDVAIKVLPAELSGDRERLQRFEQEARAAAALNHPNIVSLFDICDISNPQSQLPNPDRILFLVSELLEGETLRERLGGTALATRKAVDYAVQMANGLAAAHDKGIVHRDLKPDNLFVTSDGRVKILDFGLAKLTQPDAAMSSLSALPTTPPHTLPGVVLGTVGYMSPEQVRGVGADHRSDIFALGTIIYEMLSGRRAFTGETTMDAMMAIVKNDPPELPDDGKHVPPALARIVDRCLEKSPAARFQSTRDLAFALEGLSSHSGKTEALPHVAPRQSGRERLAWLTVAALVLVAMGFGAAMYFTARPVEQLSIRALAPPPDNWTIDAGSIPTRLAVSPDGRRVAFVARSGSNRPRIWVRRLDSLAVQQLDGTDDAAWPFWSSDSRHLGFFAEDKLKRIEASGGPVLTLCDAAVSLISGVGGSGGGTWNSDGVILFGLGRKGLHRVPASGGAPTPVVHAQNAAYSGLPFFLPDGRHFLFKVGTGGTTGPALHLGSLDSGESREIVKGAVSQGMYAQGYLLFVRETTLMAQPFDPTRLALNGDPQPLVEDVETGGAGNSAFSVSENGVIAYLAGGEQAGRLVWMDRSGKQVGVLGKGGEYSDVELSRDGTRALVATSDNGDRDLHVFDLTRDFPTRFTFGGGNETSGVWSPDDTRIIFNSQRQGGSGLYIKPVSGAVGSEQLLTSDDRSKYPFGWSPDGRYVLYGATGPNLDLVYMPIDGDRKPLPFAQTPFAEWAAKFSPDGKWVAYSSDESGRPEVWVAPFPGPGKRTQVSSEGAVGGFPRWRRDGRELFFLDSAGRLTAAEIDITGDEARVGAVVALFDSRAGIQQRYPYDVSHDGQRFLINMRLEGGERAPTPITLLVNWTAALQDKR
jgi:serine/threonine protein kinase/Tol biopolymer transport system component